MERVYQLVDLINNYDGTQETDNKMRNLICYLSEKDDFADNNIYKTVVYEAAERLRVFGYIKGVNRISLDMFKSNGVDDIKHRAIQNYYTSKVFKNNILDKKQKEVVDLFMKLDEKKLLLSAPTSFGKTFVLREILFLNKNIYNNIVLVFPTIALLNENTQNMKELVRSINADYRIINNVYSDIDINERHIFILTPERTLTLLSDEKINLDFFFFDEVYKIDDDFDVHEDMEKNKSGSGLKNKTDDRAIAFRIALYLLTKRVKEFYLAGPYLNLKNLEKGFEEYISKNNITKKQINFEPTMRIDIDAWNKKTVERHPVTGDRELSIYKVKPMNTEEKIAGIIKYLRCNNLGQAIFYCNSPSNSKNYVTKAIDKLSPEFKIKEENKPFIQHLKQKYGIKMEGIIDNTAEHWSIVIALENGYGVHHGQLPKYIQNEILKMFNRGDFENLFCTSTIIEGVNTNAKNVVIINNSVGNREMSAFALKNIKGRAGRYYHHHSGRVFFTDAKQRKIEHKHEMQLDFRIYGDKVLDNIDLDNVDINDLLYSNKKYKEERDEFLNFQLLPDEIFVKNRLYPRDVQEKYLLFILEEANFSRFKGLIHKSANIHYVLKENIINAILDTFEKTEIVEPNAIKVYKGVVGRYSFEGTKGIVKYHLEKEFKKDREDKKTHFENNSKKIDNAYIKAFKQIRNIVEYEIPKLLCLFEVIFSFAGIKKGYEMETFSMKHITRFFELGVKTEFGLSLVEYGFPIDTIQKLERKFNKLEDYSTLEAIPYLRKNHIDVVKILDEYEFGIFKNAIMEFEKA